MGWFWGTNDPIAKNPYEKLDPQLKDFLDKESPLKYEQTGPPKQTPARSNPPSAQHVTSPQASTPTPTSHPPSPAVPSESLYQDGRYADLWKNYKPLALVESSERSEQDRLQDIVDAFKERKAQIGRAAIENCVFEQLAEKSCFDNGGFVAKMTMCKTETKAFNRCYTMQARFLKALGYLSMDRTDEEDERIQMHADKLYQEMLQREKVAEEARKAGVPEPAFAPLLQPEVAAQAIGVDAAQKTTTRPTPEQMKIAGSRILAQLPEERRKALESDLAKKSPAEKDLELQLLAAEAQAGKEYTREMEAYYNEDKLRRAARREEGKETIGDSMRRLWGWDK